MLHVLAHPPPPTVHHPASVALARFLTHTLRESKEEETTAVLHLLPLIKTIWSYLRPAQLEQVASTVLSLRSSTNNTHVVLGIFEAMESFFTALVADTNLLSMSAGKLAKLNDSIMEMKPNVDDTQLLPLWLAMVVQGMIGQTRIDPASASQRLPKVYVTVFHLLQQNTTTKGLNKAVHQIVRESLHSLVASCITDDMITATLAALNDTGRSASASASATTATTTPLERIIVKTESGLGPAYQGGSAVVLDAIRYLLERLHDGPGDHGAAALMLLASPLKLLADDKKFALNEHYHHREKLHELLGCAIRVLGARPFVTLFPLGDESENEDDENEDEVLSGCRTWLFPLLQEHVCNTELGFFLERFIPLSQRFADQGQKSMRERNDPEKGKAFALVWRQIWDLLPAFCRAPVDLKEVRSRPASGSRWFGVAWCGVVYFGSYPDRPCRHLT